MYLFAGIMLVVIFLTSDVVAHTARIFNMNRLLPILFLDQTSRGFIAIFIIDFFAFLLLDYLILSV